MVPLGIFPCFLIGWYRGIKDYNTVVVVFWQLDSSLGDVRMWERGLLIEKISKDWPVGKSVEVLP